MTICRFCGKSIEDNATFCNHCGASLTTNAASNNIATSTQNAPPTLCTMALVGLILSFFIPLAGLIVSIIGRSQIKKSNGALNGGGLALAGIIVSVVSMIFTFVAVILYVVIIVFAIESAVSDPYGSQEIYWLITSFIR